MIVLCAVEPMAMKMIGKLVRKYDDQGVSWSLYVYALLHLALALAETKGAARCRPYDYDL